MIPYWLPLLTIATTSPMDWVRKDIALDKLERTYGFKDISPALLADKNWAARVTAQVTWLPQFGDSPGRRAVHFRGYDATGSLVYSLVAARATKTDADDNIAQYIENGGYFPMPSNHQDPNVYRQFTLYAHPTPFDNRAGRWAVLLEVRQKTPWHSDRFVETVFRAYGEKAPSIPSQEPAGLFMPSLAKWKHYDREGLEVSVFQTEDNATVRGIFEQMKSSIKRLRGTEQSRLSTSFTQREDWMLPDGTQVVYFFRGEPQGWPDIRKLHIPYNSGQASLTVVRGMER